MSKVVCTPVSYFWKSWHAQSMALVFVQKVTSTCWSILLSDPNFRYQFRHKSILAMKCRSSDASNSSSVNLQVSHDWKHWSPTHTEQHNFAGSSCPVSIRWKSGFRKSHWCFEVHAEITGLVDCRLESFAKWKSTE